MKKIFKFFLLTFSFLIFARPSLAVEIRQTPVQSLPIASLEATASAEATISSIPSPTQKPEVVVQKDITEPTPEVKGKLEKYLSEYPIKPLNITNFLQHAIRIAVAKGVPANTIVLILLFPLVVSLITASRHLVGIRGFGIFLPAVLSVAFVATGILAGLFLFTTIISAAMLSRNLFKRLKIQYLPRMALLLWFVSLAVFALMFLSPFINLTGIIKLSIFPVLILILLAENFISIQIGMSKKEAMGMSLETLVTALVCSIVLQLNFLQKFVLLHPEISVLGIAIFDLFMGKYAGLRLLEYKKFKELLK